jgi:tetrahydromethanopterin S-methyltransferase subunit H
VKDRKFTFHESTIPTSHLISRSAERNGCSQNSYAIKTSYLWGTSAHAIISKWNSLREAHSKHQAHKKETFIHKGDVVRHLKVKVKVKVKLIRGHEGP